MMTDRASGPAAGAERYRYRLRVHWEDTDAAGIVYYANYLKFMERARSDLVRRAGIDQARLLDDDGVVFPVRRCEVDYLRPARLEDEVMVVTAVRRVGGASIDLAQDIHRDDEVLVRGRVRLACVDRAGRPLRLPMRIRDVFTGALAAAQGAN